MVLQGKLFFPSSDHFHVGFIAFKAYYVIFLVWKDMISDVDRKHNFLK